jgi:AhpD family alkylhydroperoxidase
VLPRAFKEKIAFKVARLRGSDYCTGSHRRYALDHGVGPQELEAIDRSDYGGLEPAEQAALRFAEAMVKSGGDAGEELFAALQIHFNEAEFVEIVALVGIMELASTFAAAFDLQPD